MRHILRGQLPATPARLQVIFSEWAHGLKGSDFAVVEYSLAHMVGSKVTRAYLRTDYLEERRELMQEWGEFVGDSTIFGVDAVNFTGGEKSRQSRESSRASRRGTERIAGAPQGDEPKADTAIAADS